MPASTNVGPSTPKSGAGDFHTKPAPAPRPHAPIQPQTKTPAAPHPTNIPRPKAPAPTSSPSQAAASAAASTNTSLQSYLAYLQTNMGRTAQSMIDQEIKTIQSGFLAQQKSGDAAIVGDTQTYVNQLKGIGAQADAAYTTAEGQQQSLDTAIGSALQTGDVGAAASKLSQSLAAAGQSTAPGVAAQAAVNQTGASQYASASAGLSQLFAQGAAQKAYDATLPGIAKLAGLQGLSAYNQGLTTAEQSAVQAAQDKLPTIMNALTSQAGLALKAQNQQFNQSLALQKTEKPQIYGSGSSGYFAILPNGQNVQLTAPGAAKPVVRTQGGYIWQQDPKSGKWAPVGGTGPAPKAPPKPGTPHTKTVGGTTYQWNGTSWAKAPGIPSTPGSTKPGGGKGLTSGEEQSFLKGLPVYQRKNGVSTKVSARMNYDKAYQYLTSHGVDDQTARSDLATVYQKGWRGRSWLTNDEQGVLKKYLAKQPMDLRGGLTTIQKIGVIGTAPVNGKTYGILGGKQANILKANNALPKGQWYTDPKLGRVYLIDPNG